MRHVAFGKGENVSGKQTPAEAWADLKAVVWATVEPPLTRLAEWINRLLGGRSAP